jgi:hypothetical protein
MGSKRRSLAAGCTALALLALPAVASAEVRVGQVTDRYGDSAGPSSQDILGATAQYDLVGKVTVTATMAGPVVGVPRGGFRFTVASSATPGECAGPSVALAGFSDSTYSTVTLSDAGPQPSQPVHYAGPAIGFGAQGVTLSNRAYTCMTLTVLDSTGAVADTLDAPLFFSGFGPDRDGDGVVDNLDNCPDQVGPAPTGCFRDSDGDGVTDAADQCPGSFGAPPTGCAAAGPLPGPPGIVTSQPPTTTPTVHQPPSCSKVTLKGKSLSAARKAISKAGCKLGKVTKPKKVKKGAKLVVTKQSGKNPVAITLGAAKRR